jgi:hypothetical protein
MTKILSIAFLLISSAVHAANEWDTYSDTWMATDQLGRNLPSVREAGLPRKDKTVGLFYYIWHGIHGYDVHKDPPASDPGQGVRLPDPVVDIRSPLDISKILKAPLGQRPWGDINQWHHWGKSIFGYYTANDEWVIRRQARMFADAGIDVVIFDTTNGYHYRLHLAEYRKQHYILQRSLGGWMWEGLEDVEVVSDRNRLALKVPRQALGLGTGDFSLRFKWSDNRQTDRAIDWLIDGDTAPNARFNYRYSTR